MTPRSTYVFYFGNIDSGKSPDVTTVLIEVGISRWFEGQKKSILIMSSTLLRASGVLKKTG
jgi:hypothetical protein